MASVISKVIKGKPYYYLAVSARVEGRPRIVEQRYLGSAEDINAAVTGATVLPARTRHLGFGDLAATWGVIGKLGVVEIIDEVLGARRVDAGASVGGVSLQLWCAARRWFIRMEVEDLHRLAVVAAG